MILESSLADALFVNWFVPAATLPRLPRPLSYDFVRHGNSDVGFFSLVLFRQVGLHVRGASWLALSYPQVNARLYVHDGAGVPSAYLLKQLAPAWVVPIARTVARQPLSAGLLDFPRRLDSGGAGLDRPLRWKFTAGQPFEASGRPGDPSSREPRLGDWDATAAFFRERRRAYWSRGGALRRAESDPPAAKSVPMRVELACDDWLDSFVPFVPSDGWSTPHSAFLVPEVRLSFVLGAEPELTVAAPAAAAS